MGNRVSKRNLVGKIVKIQPNTWSAESFELEHIPLGPYLVNEYKAHESDRKSYSDGQRLYRLSHMDGRKITFTAKHYILDIVRENEVVVDNFLTAARAAALSTNHEQENESES